MIIWRDIHTGLRQIRNVRTVITGWLLTGFYISMSNYISRITWQQLMPSPSMGMPILSYLLSAHKSDSASIIVLECTRWLFVKLNWFYYSVVTNNDTTFPQYILIIIYVIPKQAKQVTMVNTDFACQLLSNYCHDFGQRDLHC